MAVTIAVGGDARSIADACVVEEGFGAQLVGDQLVVVGLVTAAERLTVRTTARAADVPTFAAGPATRRAWAAVLPAGAELVSVGTSADATSCPYRALLAALRSSGLTGEVPLAIGVGACADTAAGVHVSGTHVMAQGGLSLLRRTDAGWEALGIGGGICEGALAEPAASVCAALGGWPLAGVEPDSLVGVEFDVVTGPDSAAPLPADAEVFRALPGWQEVGARGSSSGEAMLVVLRAGDRTYRYVAALPTGERRAGPPERPVLRVVVDFRPASPPGTVMGDSVVESCTVDGVWDPLLVTQFRTVDPTQPTVRPERAWQFDAAAARMNEVNADRVACFPFRPGG